MRTCYRNSQSGIRSVVYDVDEQLMLDLLRKDVIGEKLDRHIAKFFDTEAATDGLSKKLMTSSSFMAPIATFVSRRPDSAIADMGTAAAKASKIEQFDAIEIYNDVIDSPPSRLESESEGPPRIK